MMTSTLVALIILLIVVVSISIIYSALNTGISTGLSCNRTTDCSDGLICFNGACMIPLNGSCSTDRCILGKCIDGVCRATNEIVNMSESKIAKYGIFSQLYLNDKIIYDSPFDGAFLYLNDTYILLPGGNYIQNLTTGSTYSSSLSVESLAVLDDRLYIVNNNRVYYTCLNSLEVGRPISYTPTELIGRYLQVYCGRLYAESFPFVVDNEGKIIKVDTYLTRGKVADIINGRIVYTDKLNVIYGNNRLTMILTTFNGMKNCNKD